MTRHDVIVEVCVLSKEEWAEFWKALDALPPRGDHRFYVRTFEVDPSAWTNTSPPDPTESKGNHRANDD